ncbi:MAG: hypothetical protein ACT4P6_15910 [Gemmatimonadaceae bacterium]
MTHLNDELIDAAADGAELAHNDATHLRLCAECSAQLARIRSLRARLAALPRVVEPHVDGWPQLRDTIHGRRARRRTFVSAASFALAAALLIAVVRITPTRDAASPETRTELAELRTIAPPIVVDAMAANLTIYDAALNELESHAAAERENAELRIRIDDLRRKRAALLRLASQS